MENVLEVRNLSVTFHAITGEVQAVRDISFDLHKGRRDGDRWRIRLREISHFQINYGIDQETWRDKSGE